MSITGGRIAFFQTYLKFGREGVVTLPSWVTGRVVFSSLVSLVVGSLFTITVQLIRNKRGLFFYFVQHERVGILGKLHSKAAEKIIGSAA